MNDKTFTLKSVDLSEKLRPYESKWVALSLDHKRFLEVGGSLKEAKEKAKKKSTLEQANEYLYSVFLPKYNQKFNKKSHLEEVAYRPIPEGMDLDRIFCLKEKRQIHGDHTISYKGRKYLILPTKTRFSFAKAKVEVHKRLDTSIHIFYQGEELNYKLIPVRERSHVPSEDNVLAIAEV